ncbi:MAG: FtsX-like permease family protein, partial [Vibrio sp.]
FLITDTLGNITMLIAVFGIFFATVAGEFSRKRHVALLRVLGVSAKELVCMGALQLLVFWVIAVVIAIPLGIWSSQLMMNVFIKDSFGWTMEAHMIPEKYLQTAMFSMLALLVAGALPVMRLVRRSPMKSLRDAV